jgi:tetratricopeptide (TPR) repeat protein
MLVTQNRLESAADRIALAAILDARGRPEEAQETLREALSMLEHALGPDHYEVAVRLNELAALVQRAGAPAEAAILYERALGIQRRVLGRDHADVAVTVANLAVCRESPEQSRERRTQ